MLDINFTNESLICRILGIDNGSDKVGFTVCDYNISTGRVDVVLCETFSIPSNYRVAGSRSLYHRGAFQARVDMIAEYFSDLLDDTQPDIIGCESPFGFRMMQAFKTLTLSMQMFDDVAYDKCPNVDFVRISPFEAKKAAAGDSKFSQDKDKVHEYILKNKNIFFDENIDVKELGPDALDSVSVALATIKYVVY